jgi:hypothetical protein
MLEACPPTKTCTYVYEANQAERAQQVLIKSEMKSNLDCVDSGISCRVRHSDFDLGLSPHQVLYRRATVEQHIAAVVSAVTQRIPIDPNVQRSRTG